MITEASFVARTDAVDHFTVISLEALGTGASVIRVASCWKSDELTLSTVLTWVVETSIWSFTMLSSVMTHALAMETVAKQLAFRLVLARVRVTRILQFALIDSISGKTFLATARIMRTDSIGMASFTRSSMDDV